MRITLRELRRIIRETIEGVAEGDVREADRDPEEEKRTHDLRKAVGMDTRGKAVRAAVAKNKANQERPFSLNKDDYL